MRALLVAGALFSLSLSLGACGGGRGPDAVAKEFLARVADLDISSTTAARKAVVDMLAAPSRAVIEGRAGAAKDALGVDVDVADVVRFLGYTRGDRVASVELVDEQEATATVAVRYVDAVAEGGTNEDPVRLELVKEDGAWRILLPLAPRAAGPGGPAQEGAPR